VTISRRLAAVVAALALCAGNLAVCAGWQATPEARMACCMSGTACPMHESEGHDHSSHGTFSQTQADTCCAASAERRDSSAAGSLFASSRVIALAPAASFIGPAQEPMTQEWRALVPLPIASTPKHLLLSVLIV
jgi:hypothetical protein